MKALRLWRIAGLAASLSIDCFASATDVYVTPNGSPNGVCTANTHTPTWFNDSANWGSGTSQIGPGTTVHLCGTFTGTAGQQLFAFRGSGTAGNPITLRFESGAALSAPYWSWAISIDNRNYVTIDGGTNGVIQNTANGTTRTYQQGTTAISAHSCNNCEIKNLIIANMYVHQKCLASSGCDGVTGHGTKAIYFSGSNVAFHDLTIHDVDMPLHQATAAPDENISIYNNNIYNFNMSAIGGDSPLNNIYIYNNHFHDMDVWDTGAANYYHHEAIHAWGGAPIQNLYIYNNLFDGNQGDCCVTAWIYIEGNSILGTAYIFNNVVVGSIAVPGQVIVSSGVNHLIYNNTFISPGTCLALNSSVTNVKIVNNAFDGCSTYIDTGYDNGGPPTYNTIDYNVYGFANPSSIHWSFGSKTGSTFSAWQASCGCDLHSRTTMSTHLALSGTGVPQSGYIGIAAGMNLMGSATGTLAALGQDTGAGNTRTPWPRPSLTSWNIGAYEDLNGASPTPPTPPSGLSASAR